MYKRVVTMVISKACVRGNIGSSIKMHVYASTEHQGTWTKCLPNNLILSNWSSSLIYLSASEWFFCFMHFRFAFVFQQQFIDARLVLKYTVKDLGVCILSKVKKSLINFPITFLRVKKKVRNFCFGKPQIIKKNFFP